MSDPISLAERSLSDRDLRHYERDLRRRELNTPVGYLLLVFLGGMGAHKFYLRQAWAGLGYMLTNALGVCLMMASGLSILTVFSGTSPAQAATDSRQMAAVGMGFLSVVGVSVLWDLFTMGRQAERYNLRQRWLLLGTFSLEVMPPKPSRGVPWQTLVPIGIGLLVAIGMWQGSSKPATATAPSTAVTAPQPGSNTSTAAPPPSPAADRWTKYVGFTGASAEYLPADMMAERFSAVLRVHCQLQNVSSKAITGVRLTLRCLDSFGETRNDFVLRDDARIASGSVSSGAGYWEYEDNQFEDDEPYDRVASCVQAGTAKWQVSISAISFGDGSQLTFGDDVWRSPSR